MDRTPIFAALRRLLGRGLRQREVDAMDAAISAAAGPAEPVRSIGTAGLALIRKWEGCARIRSDGMVEAYPDPGSKDGHPWTIGWGSTGPGIAPGTVWTQAACDARLATDVARFAAEVAAALQGAPTTQAQFDALVSFHYNTGAIARATLTRLHREGEFSAAQAEFGRWINAGGKPLRGLIRRRADEAALYAVTAD